MSSSARTRIFLLSLLVATSTSAQEPSNTLAPNAQIEELRARVIELETELEDARERLAEIDEEFDELDRAVDLHERTEGLLKDVSFLQGASAVVVFGLTIGLVLVWQRAKRRIDELVAAKAEELLYQRFAEESDRRYGQIARQFSDLVNLLSHAQLGQYDRAIESLRWDRRRETLQEYPVEIRKQIILSVVQSEKYKVELSAAAWDEAEAILREGRMTGASDDKREADLAFLYVLARATSEWTRGFGYWHSFGHEIAITSDPQGFAALVEILRMNLRLKHALDATRQYQGPETDDVLHVLGHLYYNIGAFDKAEAHFSPLIGRILASSPEQAPANWAKVVFSFLMNCIDRGRAENGLKAARYAVRWGGDSLLQLAVLRLALALKEDSNLDIASELADGVRRNLKGAKEDSPTLQAQALLMVFDRGDEGAAEAVDLLRTKQEEVLTQDALALLSSEAKPSAGSSVELERRDYFYVCLMGELQIQIGYFDEARQTLQTPSLKDREGSATFLIARSYAKEGRDKEAVKYVEQAGMIFPCWCAIVERHPELKKAHEHLNRRPCRKVPELKPPDERESLDQSRNAGGGPSGSHASENSPSASA